MHSFVDLWPSISQFLKFSQMLGHYTYIATVEGNGEERDEERIEELEEKGKWLGLIF